MRNFIGRKNVRRRRDDAETSLSYLDLSASFPVSFLNLRAFFSKMVTAYVSRININRRHSTKAVTIATSQNVHLHPKDFEVKLPMIGPIVGPMRGIILAMDIAVPLCSGRNKSPMIAEPSTADSPSYYCLMFLKRFLK